MSKRLIRPQKYLQTVLRMFWVNLLKMKIENSKHIDILSKCLYVAVFFDIHSHLILLQRLFTRLTRFLQSLRKMKPRCLQASSRKQQFRSPCRQMQLQSLSPQQMTQPVLSETGNVKFSVVLALRHSPHSRHMSNCFVT